MSPRKSVPDLTLGGPRVRRHEPPRQTGSLTWHHTEFGRRSACETYHIVFSDGWQLLDADWNALGAPHPTIEAACLRAEALARSRARR